LTGKANGRNKCAKQSLLNGVHFLVQGNVIKIGHFVLEVFNINKKHKIIMKYLSVWTCHYVATAKQTGSHGNESVRNNRGIIGRCFLCGPYRDVITGRVLGNQLVTRRLSCETAVKRRLDG
jgi:hypothetical protein